MRASDAHRLIALAYAKGQFPDALVETFQNRPARPGRERRLLIGAANFTSDGSFEVIGSISFDEASGARFLPLVDAFMDGELLALGHEPEPEPEPEPPAPSQESLAAGDAPLIAAAPSPLDWTPHVEVVEPAPVEATAAEAPIPEWIPVIPKAPDAPAL